MAQKPGVQFFIIGILAILIAQWVAIIALQQRTDLLRKHIVEIQEQFIKHLRDDQQFMQVVKVCVNGKCKLCGDGDCKF